MPAERTYVPPMPALPAAPITAQQLTEIRIPGKQVELVRGRLLVKEPPGYRHGGVTLRLAAALMAYVDAHGLGDVVVGDPGFILSTDPDTVRGPDIAFVHRDRAPHPPPVGYASIAPDLVVEVLSPTERPGELLAKVGDWLEAGTRIVWVVDPQRRLARVYRRDGTETTIAETESLTGEDLLPDFTCSLAQIL